MVENQRNLDYYLRVHGPNSIIETDVNWTLWWHYHAERGGTVALYDQRLWAVNATQEHRLALPDPTWLTRLGHCEHAVELRELSGALDHGTAAER
jgi:hypothetical protein